MYCNYVEWKAKLALQLRDYPWSIDFRLQGKQPAPNIVLPKRFLSPAPQPKKAATKREWSETVQKVDVKLFERTIAKLGLPPRYP